MNLNELGREILTTVCAIKKFAVIFLGPALEAVADGVG